MPCGSSAPSSSSPAPPSAGLSSAHERGRSICGIAGFSIHPDEPRCNANRLARELLLGIQHRGTDATGAAWRLDSGGVQVQKRDLPASKFVQALSVPRKATTAILHTRYATQGHPKYNENNHPIATGGIVGVHNGMVANDTSLFLKLPADKRTAEVDSEAIFAMLAYGEEHVPLVKDVTDVLEMVYGSAAIAWMDMQDSPDVLHLARVKSSPLVLAQTKAGSLIFASEKEAIIDAASVCRLEIDWMGSMDEGDYAIVKHGIITDGARFSPATYATYTGTPGWQKGSTSNAKFSGSRYSGTNNSWEDDWCDTCGGWKEYSCKCEDALEDWQQNGLMHQTDEDEERKSNLIPFPAWEEGEAVEVLDAEDPMVDVVRAQEPGYDLPRGEWKDSLIEANNLFCGHKMSRPSDGTWETQYHRRLTAIDRWADRTKNHFDSADTLEMIARKNHAWVRPGDWVTTEMLGTERWAEVVDVPNTFPVGEYVLRVLVPKATPFAFTADQEPDVEMVLCRRRSTEFQNFTPEGKHTLFDDFLPPVPPTSTEVEVYDEAALKADLSKAEQEVIEDPNLLSRLTAWLQGNPNAPADEVADVIEDKGAEFISVPNPETGEFTLVRINPTPDPIDALV